MTLNAPSQTMFIVAVVIAVIALLGAIVGTIPFISAYAFWILIVAFIVLAAAVMMKGA